MKSTILENLEKVYLNNNNIKSVPDDMLPNKLCRLCELNLAENKISSMGEMPAKVLGFMDQRIGFTPSCNLNLSKNSLTVQRTNFIQTSTRDSNFNMSGYLDLSYNNISRFEEYFDFALRRVPYVTIPFERLWLNTKGNKFFSVVNLVKAALNYDLNNINQGISRLKLPKDTELLRLQVLIKAFPYEYDCNCDMEKYLKLQTLKNFKIAMKRYRIFLCRFPRYCFLKSEIFMKSLKCGSPNHLSGKYLHELKKTDLQCEHSRCIDNEKCKCTETPGNSTYRINCTKTKIKLKRFFIDQNSSSFELYLGHNNIKKIPIANITLSMQVILLDLSYNYITNIPSIFFSHYPNMRHLNLAGNLLTTISSTDEWKIIKSLKVLEFRGNNFVCNCSGLELKETLVWLNARPRTTVEDLNQIKCSLPSSVKDKVIYDLPTSLFGCPFVNLVLIFTLTLSLLLFLSIVSLIAYIFRYYIHLFLFVHFGWRFRYSYKKEKTLYDAFISYSSKDSDWVIDQLMNPLENLDPPYNLCLHERDFLIGEPICDNIRKAVEGSKCTVCVVSKNWLESEWCQFEFRVAHSLAIVEKQIRLLVILKEEIPKNKISGYLKFYMKTFTYLDRSHPLFWSRLLNDLPRPDGDNIRLENEQRDDIELM